MAAPCPRRACLYTLVCAPSTERPQNQDATLLAPRKKSNLDRVWAAAGRGLQSAKSLGKTHEAHRTRLERRRGRRRMRWSGCLYHKAVRGATRASSLLFGSASFAVFHRHPFASGVGVTVVKTVAADLVVQLAVERRPWVGLQTHVTLCLFWARISGMCTILYHQHAFGGPLSRPHRSVRACQDCVCDNGGGSFPLPARLLHF